MPRVTTKTKNRGGTKTYRCSGCKQDDNEIKPGERYHQWSFRYGGTYRRHVDCGYPRRSELTQAIYGGLLDSMDAAEAAIDAATTVEDIESIMEELGGEVEELRDQYEEAAEAFQGGGPNGEKKEEFEQFYDEFEQFDPEEPDTDRSEEEVLLAATREYLHGQLPPEMQDDYPDEESIPEVESDAGRALLDALGLVPGSGEMLAAVNTKVEEWQAEQEEKVETARQAAHDVIGNSPV